MIANLRKKIIGLSMLAAMSMITFLPHGVAANDDKSKVEPLMTTAAVSTDRLNSVSSQVLDSAKNNKKMTVVTGSVTSVSDTSLTVWGRKQNGNNQLRSFTFSLNSSTFVLRKMMGLGSIGDIQVGDKVQVWANKDSQAVVIWDQSVWYTELSGTVAAIDNTAKSFRLLVMVNGSPRITTVNTDDSTIFRLNNAAATFGDLAVDQDVTVSGVWHDVGKTIDAASVMINGSGSTESVVATITQPVSTAKFTSGQAVNFAGTCTDGAMQPIAGCTFSWQADLINNGTISVIYGPTAPSADMNAGSFTPALTAADGASGFIRLFLTVESNGTVRTVSQDIHPVTSVLSLATVPTGLNLTVDGATQTAPFTLTAVAGTSHTLAAPTTQVVSGVTHTFVSWSDGGAASHTITAPATNTTYTATYTQ